MKITIIPSDAIVGVSRVFRAISMAGIDPSIHAVQFDTNTNAGHVERAGMPNEPISSILPFQVFLDRWTAAAPVPHVPTPEEIAAAARLAGYDTAINADATIAQLKTITVTQFGTWWDNNVTNLAQLNAVVRKLTWLVIRRLL